MTDLSSIATPPCPERAEIGALAKEHGLHLMEMTMDALHGVVLADILADVDQTTGRDGQTQLLQHLPPHGVGQGLTVFLATAGQDEELPFLGTDAHGQQGAVPQDDGAGRRADGRGLATGGRGGSHGSPYAARRRGESAKRGVQPPRSFSSISWLPCTALTSSSASSASIKASTCLATAASATGTGIEAT
jgi:hypothetical protein